MKILSSYQNYWQKTFTYYGGKKHLPFKVKQWIELHKYEFIYPWYFGKETRYSQLVIAINMPKITGKKLTYYSWIKRRFKK